MDGWRVAKKKFLVELRLKRNKQESSTGLPMAVIGIIKRLLRLQVKGGCRA